MPCEGLDYEMYATVKSERDCLIAANAELRDALASEQAERRKLDRDFICASRFAAEWMRRAFIVEGRMP